MGWGGLKQKEGDVELFNPTQPLKNNQMVKEVREVGVAPENIRERSKG